MSSHEPYLSARREWNERYGDYIARAKNWRLAAFGSILVSAILALGVIWLASQSKLVPFVVEVDKLGQAVAVRRADRAASPDRRIVQAQIAAWIVDVRSVSSDPVAQKEILSRAYSLVDSSGAGFLNEYYKENSPFDEGQQQTVSCSIDAVLPISDNTYQVQWTEDARDLQGRVFKTTHWQASLDVAFNPPTDEAGMLENPMGIYIHGISWTQQL